MRSGPGLVVAMAVLAACQRIESSTPAPSPTPSPTTIATAPAKHAVPAAPTTLAGEWRVAGIDGKPFNEPYGLALSADDRRIWWEPQCAGVARGYRMADGRIAVGPDPDLPPRRPGDATRPVCAIGLPERLDEVMRSLDRAETIRRTPSNGIEISGGGHSLTLFSQ